MHHDAKGFDNSVKNAIVLGVLAATLLPAGAMAQTYVGKFCFSSTITER